MRAEATLLSASHWYMTSLLTRCVMQTTAEANTDGREKDDGEEPCWMAKGIEAEWREERELDTE